MSAENPTSVAGHEAEMARVAECVAPWAEKAIRLDERLALADLFDADAETLAGFAPDKERLLAMLAWLLRLGVDVLRASP